MKAPASPVSAALATAAVQAGDVAEGAPSIVGVGAQVMFYAMLVVMLLVPWIMARQPPARGPRLGETGLVRPLSGSLYTSRQERRLWLWTAIVLAAILATLGPVEVLAAALRERNLLRVSSAAVLLVVVAVVAVPWAKRRPGGLEVGAALGITAVYLVTLIRLPVPEARSHLFEYGLVAILIYHALLERRRNGRRVPEPAVLAVVTTAVLGWLDEGIQLVLPNRVYDLVDVGFNALAGLMAVIASVLMAWARRWDLRGLCAKLLGGG